MKTIISLAFFASLLLFSCEQNKKEDHTITAIKKAALVPTIDGQGNDLCWQNNSWLPLDQLWLGNTYTPEDFSGKYKLSWSDEALYLLVEIKDDVLFDQYEDPLELWWDDDCVEVFIDADNSGGNHQFNHNAFAYHIALDGNVVDLGPNENPHLYNNHITSRKLRTEDTVLWEIAIKVYNDTYTETGEHTPISLSAGQSLGFALAYCDNDGSKERENFIGSVFVPGEDKNQGWIDANIFGTLALEE